MGDKDRGDAKHFTAATEGTNTKLNEVADDLGRSTREAIVDLVKEDLRSDEARKHARTRRLSTLDDADYDAYAKVRGILAALGISDEEFVSYLSVLHRKQRPGGVVSGYQCTATEVPELHPVAPEDPGGDPQPASDELT